MTILKTFGLALVPLLLIGGATAADLELAQKPMELAQGVSPNVVIIMDDSGSMDWEVITKGYNNSGLFAYNQNKKEAGDVGSEIFDQDFCTITRSGTYYGYKHGVQFASNFSPSVCDTAHDLAWRFRNSVYNPLYYDPTKIYEPWPGLSTTNDIDTLKPVPYSELTAYLSKTRTSFGLLGFDNPANPVEFVDLVKNGAIKSSEPVYEVDGIVGGGFAYYDWTDNQNVGEVGYLEYNGKYTYKTYRVKDGADGVSADIDLVSGSLTSATDFGTAGVEVGDWVIIKDPDVPDHNGVYKITKVATTVLTLDTTGRDFKIPLTTPITTRIFDVVVPDNKYIWDDAVADADTVMRVLVKDLDVDKQKNFQNWFNFYRSRNLSVKAALHVVLEDIDSLRLGYTTLNSSGNDFPVETLNPSIYGIDGAKARLMKEIDTTISNGFTPLRTALRDVGNYFSAASTDNKFGADTHPYIILDDGSGSIAEAAMCQQNYAMLFTDGYWNRSDPGVGNTDEAGSAAVDGRGPFDGETFGDVWSNTLADVAMHYYETDLMPGTLSAGTGIDNNVPVTATDRYPEVWPREPAPIECDPTDTTGPFDCDQTTMHQNMKTYTIAFGLGDGDDAIPSAWSDPTDGAAPDNKREDLVHAAYNGRGNFSGADDFTSLASNLNASFTNVFSEQSGAAGIAFNSQELKTGTTIFRAFYNPATYTGDLVAVKFNKDGVPDLANPEWSAGTNLMNRLCPDATNPDVCFPNDRLIVSFDPTGGLYGNGAGIPFDYDTGLNATQKAWFKGPLTDDPTDGDLREGPTDLPSPYGNGDTDYADERVAFLHGDRSNEGTRFNYGELRERVGLLGDFANSTPRYVGAPQGRNRDRFPYPVDPIPLPEGTESKLYSTFNGDNIGRAEVVYVGANDGMLHAFDANTGRERFAYVPNIIMEDLYKYTLPDYDHKMSVDGSPGINDVYIKDARAAGKSHWRTILMGGLRAGGKGYYALDITKPETFSKDNVLWEFTAANDSRLGYTFSTPNLVMSNAKDSEGNQRWIALFGNGYNNPAAANSGLFALFLDQGEDTTWDVADPQVDWRFIDTGTSGVSVTNGLGTPRAVDNDGNGTVDYVYAGDLEGNLYRFDLTSPTPSSWTVAKLFTATGPSGARQPITVQPIVSKVIISTTKTSGTKTTTTHTAKPGLLINVSTGSWMAKRDLDYATANVESIYGIWDHAPTAAPPLIARDELVTQAFTNVTDPLNGYYYRTLSANLVEYNSTAKGATKRVMGWKLDLDLGYKGEKAIRNLLVKDGVLFGTTIIPSSNSACMNAPGGFLFSMDAQTGGSMQEKPAFDLNGDGVFDDKDYVDVDGDGVYDFNDFAAAIRIEDGLPSDIAVIDGGANDGSKVCYQTSSGELICTTVNVDSKFKEGRMSWKELSN